MGVGPHALALYVDLATTGDLRPGQSVMEIGSQDVVAEDFDLAMLSVFGGKPLAKDGSARELMTRLGFSSYHCIDMDGRHGAIPLDLNTMRTDAPMMGQFDVVTNFGTTEHVFDQARCFELIHNLGRPGGLMIHIVPTQGPRQFLEPSGEPNVGYGSHGFFLYTPHFFTDLAHANGYETVRHYDKTNKYGTSLVIVLRRTNNDKFEKPIQGIYR